MHGKYFAGNQRNLANNWNTPWDHPSSIILNLIFRIYPEKIEVLGYTPRNAGDGTDTDTYKYMDIALYILRRPRGRFSEEEKKKDKKSLISLLS